ncbi:MAG: GAF domain-containing protein [Xenococcaceae cyanobacterium MO_167.B52]|nr:GAF domain-containing protein [Xenococcaceae cyanobacterium MO_167.B52]
MVFNWLFDSPDEPSQEGQDSNSNDGLLVTEKQNQLSNLSKINVDDLSQNNGKEELMSVQKINPQKRTNVEAVEVNSDPMNNGTSINLSLTANDVLRKINQEAQQLMNDGVNKIRQSLKADRVLVYGFNPDGSGKILAESLDSGWSRAGSAFDQDYFISENNAKPYYVVNDISTKNFAQCFVESLEAIEAQAYINVPIKYNNELLGFLSAYQNSSPRDWQESEVQMMVNCATQFRLPLQQTAFMRHNQFREQQREKAIKRERGLAQMLEQIRNATEEDKIFQIATQEGRKFLEVDRLAIYRFEPDWSGKFIAESVAAGWTKLIDTMLVVQDTFLQENQGGRYKLGECFTVDDIYLVGHQPCHIQLLEQFEARAYMIAPIFSANKKLWGLIAAYQNTGARKWQLDEAESLRQLGLQVGIGMTNINSIKEIESQVKEQEKIAQQERTVAKLVQKVQQSEDLRDIFRTATNEVRQLLECDRVVVYQFKEDWSGEVLAESMSSGWVSVMQLQETDDELYSTEMNASSSCTLKYLQSSSALDNDTYFKFNQGGDYTRGKKFQVVNDIYSAGFSACYLQSLEKYQAKAYMIVPIFQENKLWGLFAVYQNSGIREWYSDELNLLLKIAPQLGIAIEQAEKTEQLRKTVARQRSLAQMVDRMRDTSSLENVLEIAAQETRKLLGGDRSSIYQFNADWTGQNVVEAPIDKEFKSLQDSCFLSTFANNSYPYLQKNQGGKYRDGESCIVSDISESNLEQRLIEVLERLDIKAYVRMPIFVEQQLWGIINIYQSRTRVWQQEDIELLKRIVVQVGIVIQQKQNLAALQTQAQQEKTISKIVQRIGSSLKLTEIFRTATQEVRQLLQVDRAVVYRFNPDWTGEVLAESAGSEWISVMEIQKTDETLFSKEMNANEQCTLKNLQAGSALDEDTYFINTQGGDYTRGKQFNVVNDVYSAGFSPCYLQSLEKYQARAYIIVPVFQNNKLWGLFAVYQNSGPREWQSNELNLLLRIAPQLGIAIEQAELLGQIQTSNQELAGRSERESAIIQFSSRLMSRFAGLMQKSNNSKKIMEFATSELRRVLEADRVTIYRFAPNWSGTFVVESVAAGWPKLVGTELAAVKDSYLQENQGGRYIKGECSQVNDIHQVEGHDLPLTLLEELNTKAYLVVPIFKGERLWGLLGIYQNDQPRQWDSSEQAILEQVATNIGVTLQVGEYFTKLRSQEEQLSKLVKQERNQRESLQQGALRVLRALEPSFRGDLTVRAPLSEDEIGTIADGYNTTIQSMRGLVRQVQISASRVSDTSSANSQSVSELSEQARMQVQQLQQALQQLEFMVSSTEEVATCANKVEETVEEANRTVQAGDSLMERTVDEIMEIRHTVSDTAKKIKRLGETFQKITKVVSLIENFATQTNLLALNAAIEATRAGEYGKGFAVVADEVRSLAYQSANATTEISRLVEEIQTETNDVTEAMEVGIAQVVNGTNLVRETQQSLNAIVTSTNDIKELVQEITQAAANQSQQSEMLTKVMMDVSAIAGETSQGAAQISASFGELETTSRELQTSVSQFKVD